MGLNQITDDVIVVLQARFGGNVMRYAARTTGSRPMYRWRVNDRKAAAVAADLLSYLRIKRRDAELLLAMRADKDRPRTETTRAPSGRRFDCRHWTGKTIPLPAMTLHPEIAARRETLYQEMRSLHDAKNRQTQLFSLRT